MRETTMLRASDDQNPEDTKRALQESMDRRN